MTNLSARLPAVLWRWIPLPAGIPAEQQTRARQLVALGWLVALAAAIALTAIDRAIDSLAAAPLQGLLYPMFTIAICSLAAHFALRTALQSWVAVFRAQAGVLSARDEAARLEGVLLAARTAEHELNNRLSLTAGYAEVLADDPRLPPDLLAAAAAASAGARAAADVLAQLQRLTELRTHDWGPLAGPTLRLEETQPSPDYPTGDA